MQVERSTTPPEIHAFPADDEEFADETRRAVLVATAELNGDPAGLAERVLERLHDRYPDAMIQRRHDLADVSSLGPPVWYVFRDGGLRPSD